MKNFLILTSLYISIFLSPTFTFAQKQPHEISNTGTNSNGKYALVIGSNNYNSSVWPTLYNAETDAKAIAKVLSNKYGFECNLLLSPTKSKVEKQLYSYHETLKENDRLLIYIAGHGDFDETYEKDGFIVFKDSESPKSDIFHNSYLGYQKFQRILDVLPSKHIGVILDVCFGGTFNDQLINRGKTNNKIDIDNKVFFEKYHKKGRLYLTSGAKEPVLDGKPGHYSPFCYSLLEILEQRSNKLITLSHIYNHLLGKTNTNPIFGHFGKDDISSFFMISDFNSPKKAHIITNKDISFVSGTIYKYHGHQKDIIIPNKIDGELVTRISQGAFSKRQLTSIDLSKSTALEVIEKNAFADNNLTELNLANNSSLIKIGRGAFYRNQINKIDLSNNTLLKEIGIEAFAGNDLTELNLTNNVSLIKIRLRAFYKNHLKKIDFPNNASLKEIGIEAFAENDLTELNLTNNDSLIKIENGAFYENKLTKIDLSNNTSLKEIGVQAFARNELTELNLTNNDSLIKIENGAFYKNQLTNINLSNLSTLNEIGNQAFAFNKLTSVDLSNNRALIKIGEEAFISNQIMSVDLSNNIALKEIGEFAFANNKLINVNLSNNTNLSRIDNFSFTNNQLMNVQLSNCTALSYIGHYAFENNKLSYIDLSKNSKLVHIGAGAFHLNQMKSFTLPIPDSSGSWNQGKSNSEITNLLLEFFFIQNFTHQLNQKDVIIRGGKITEYLSEYTNISIPKTINGIEITSIGDFAFRNCKLTNIDFSKSTALVSIGKYAFYENSLTNIDLSNNTKLTSIGFSAFAYNQLSSFKLPTPDIIGKWNSGNSGETITDLEFSYYYTPFSTHEVYEITTKDVTFKNGEIINYNGKHTNIMIPEFIDGVQVISIAKNAFEDKNLIKIDLSKCIALRRIGENAFANNNLSEIDLSLNIMLSSIGMNAFYKNDIKSIDLSNNTELVDIGKNIIQGTSFMLPLPKFKGSWNIGYSGEAVITFYSHYYYTYDEPYEIKLSDVIFNDGEIIEYLGVHNNIKIPRCFLDKPITSINDDVFCDFNKIYVVGSVSKKIINVDLSNTTELISIGRNAFTNNSLTKIDLSKNTKLYNIGDKAFASNNLTDINLSNTEVSSIWHEVFASNNLSNVDLSNTKIKYIGKRAFANNSLIEIDFTNTEVNYIGVEAFIYNNLTDIKLPISCTSIGASAFAFNNLTDINLSNNTQLKIIESGVFGCNKIESINLNNCTLLYKIGEYAFYDNNLTNVDLSNNINLTEIGSRAFEKNKLSKLMLPQSDTSDTKIWFNSKMETVHSDSITNFTSGYWLKDVNKISD
ncbi:leucine-rich repeat protein [Flammeovirga sp. SJP92]|uniref:leucine-rich repeat protein n=1 Tax=Flammeovirga sp. SJP92 TaxID=1775430 RepID=UPI000789A66E|nr:leucine-rich repeat protein [Flammeovirga sp. SJP92]KXX70471.1 hypothetical protein AVL50_08925 [Flammeovirga sp. SJP92]